MISIIGAGSAGAKYAQGCSRLNYPAQVYDLDFDRAQAICDGLEGVTAVKHSIDLCGDYLILAVPAGYRMSQLKTRLATGLKGVLVEKLIANSQSELSELLEQVDKFPDVVWATHTRWSALSVDVNLDRISADYALGDLRHVSTFGSGICAVSGGIHWLAFTLQKLKLEGQRDLEIVGSISSSKSTNRFGGSQSLFGSYQVNTRDGAVFSVNYFDGGKVGPMAIFEFEKGRAVMNFDGRSYLSLPEGGDMAGNYSPAGELKPIPNLTSDSDPFEAAIQALCAPPSLASSTSWAAATRATALLIDFLDAQSKRHRSESAIFGSNGMWNVS